MKKGVATNEPLPIRHLSTKRMNTNIENISENQDHNDFEVQYREDLRDEYRLQDRIDQDECRSEFEN